MKFHFEDWTDQLPPKTHWMEVIRSCISDSEMAGFLQSDIGIVEKRIKTGKLCL